MTFILMSLQVNFFGSGRGLFSAIPFEAAYGKVLRLMENL